MASKSAPAVASHAASAANASANGAAHAASNSAAAASSANAASNAATSAANAGGNGAANAASNAAASASNAGAKGAANAASNSAAAANAANGAVQSAANAAAAGGPANAASNFTASMATAASNASANGAAHAASNSIAAIAASDAASAASVGSNAGGNAANTASNAAAAAAAASSASNASANGAAHAASNAAAAASAASNASALASNASANGAAHAASNSAAAAAAGAIAAAIPPGLAAKAGSPPGLAQSGGLPPGLAGRGAPPPGLAQNGGHSPGQPNLVGSPPAAAPDNVSAPSAPPPALALGPSGGPGLGPTGAGDAPPDVAPNGGSPTIIQIGGPSSYPGYQSGTPSIILVNTGPSASDGGASPITIVADGGDLAQGFSPGASRLSQPDDAQGPGGVGGPSPGRKESAASDQQRKVLAALGSGLLEQSRTGAIVRKGEVVAVAPTTASLARARSLGFVVVEQLPLKALGLTAFVLRAPPNMTADQALSALQAADPDGGYTLNPIYATTGRVEAAAGPAPASGAPAGGTRGGAAVGLIDTGVFEQHPALADARVEQQGFAPGGLTPDKHGTAVASIAAGQAGAFHGVAPGSRIYVADVYGKTGAGGAASSVAEGIDWLVRKGAPVINISLVGPPNKLMEAAVEAAIKKGVIVVAAVGNDGPNSPPLYPAAYRGVLAVTGVDQNDHILFEAVRATRVAFAAPGADIFAADGVAGFAKVRGTSFAAPIVAGQLALAHRRIDSKDADNAIERLKHAAKAPAATDAAFGFGIVGEDARQALRPGLTQITTAEAEPAQRSKE